MEGLVKCRCGCGRYITQAEYDEMNERNVMHGTQIMGIVNKESHEQDNTKE